MMIRGVIYAVVSAFCYGLLAIFGKLGFEMGLGAIELQHYRFIFGSAALVFYHVVLRRKKMPLDRRMAGYALLFGVCFYFPQSMMFFFSLKYLPASMAALILYLYPLVVLVLSWFMLRAKFDMSSLVSVVMILGGIALVFYDAFLIKVPYIGVLLALGACVTFSFNLILGQMFLARVDKAVFTAYMLIATTLAYTVVHNPLELLTLDAKQLSLSITVGVVTSAMAIALLYRAIETIGASYTAIFSSLEPVFTVIIAWLVLGESIDGFRIIGMVLVVLGVVWPNLKPMGLSFSRQTKV